MPEFENGPPNRGAAITSRQIQRARATAPDKWLAGLYRNRLCTTNNAAAGSGAPPPPAASSYGLRDIAMETLVMGLRLGDFAVA